ncbi:MAG: phage tail protein [Candidatus Izemoplasma sp.]
MPINIQAFKGSFNDLHRANKFEVLIPGVTGSEFHCKAAQIPSETMGVINVPFNGRQTKIAGDRTYEPWTVTFMLTDDLQARADLYDWLRSINDAESNVSGPPSSYRRDITVTALNQSGAPAGKVWNLVDGWPSNVSAIELSFDSQDTISELPVTFEFDHMT